MAKTTKDITDEVIVSKVQGGDKDMYAVVVERYEQKLLRYAIYLLKDHDVAADIVQDTFIKAYINLQSFDVNKKFSSWIYRITHNEAMNHIKRYKKSFSFSDMQKDGDDFLADYTLEKVVDKNLMKASVQKCLKVVDIKYQEIIGLYYFEGLKYEEISDILHIPTSTVGVRINRARKILKDICESQGVSYE
jgi:RNA polymerase sigma-70 factor (ECF subfamily)